MSSAPISGIAGHRTANEAPAVNGAVTRPNGKVYRPRKAPAVLEFDDMHGDFGGVAVLRTHDVEVAMKLAMNIINSYEMDPAKFSLEWMRDAMRDGGRQWVNDPDRGFPAVVWECEW